MKRSLLVLVQILTLSSAAAEERSAVQVRFATGPAFFALSGRDIASNDTADTGLAAAGSLALTHRFGTWSFGGELSGAGAPQVGGGLVTLGPQAVIHGGSFYGSITPRLSAASATAAAGGAIGRGGKLAVGKEWCLSHRWNVGVEAYGTVDHMVGFFLFTIPSSTWTVFSGGVSLTFSTR